MFAGYAPDFVVVDDPEHSYEWEEDSELRLRIWYVNGKPDAPGIEGRLARQAVAACDRQLDAIAEEVGLSRRRLK